MPSTFRATSAAFADGPPRPEQAATTGRIVLASLVGTTIEFYDFYIYGTAAALVIGQTFFPQAAPGAQALNAFLTFGIAFLGRPLGSVLFGHFGDRIGRKPTLVVSMLVMGLSTPLIGVLPGYATAARWRPGCSACCGSARGSGLAASPGVGYYVTTAPVRPRRPMPDAQ